MRVVTSSATRHARIVRFVLVMLAAVALCASFVTVIAAAGRPAAATPHGVVFIVNSTGDQGDALPGDGVCLSDGGVCTLRAALDEANFSATPATVRFGLALPATIQLGAALQVGGSVAVQGPTTGTLTLDGQKVSQHFDIEPGGPGPVTISITHLSLVNGWSASDGGSVIVRYTTQPADVAFERVVFGGNSAADRGGAVFSDARYVRIVDSLFADNTAGSGGAVANVGGSLRIDRSTLAGNQATDGGALFNTDYGLASRHGVMTVTVSTLADNQALARGGALFNESQGGFGAATWVRGATIVRNNIAAAAPGSAGGGAFNGDASTLVMNSTIMAANTRGTIAPRAWDDCLSLSGGLPARALGRTASPDSYLTGGDNLVGAGASSGCPAGPGDIQTNPQSIFTNVLHDQLVSYDGSQPMFALRPTSPAIDRTPAGSQLCGSGLTVDQRGAPKPLGPACDIGAYEAALPALVMSRTLSLDVRSCSTQSSVELATGAVAYSCATVINTGNVAFTHTELSVPGRSQNFVLPQPLAPGQAVTLTAAQFPALEPMAVLGDSLAGVFGAGDSQWSTPPGIPSQTAGKGQALARPVDVAMQVTAEPFGFGAIRTVTATVTYHQTGAIIPQRRVQLNVSGGTTAQLPAQVTNGQGKAVFSYISFSPLTPATTASRGVPSRVLAAGPAAVQATDFLQMWVDLNGNGVRDPFEPFTAAGLPTAIGLASFDAQPAAQDAVLLRWRTATEVDIAGFNVRRAIQPGGLYIKVNDNLIPSQGAGLGSEYLYTDHPGAAGTYYYKLEEVGSDGSRVLHGPVAVVLGDPIDSGQRLLLPWIAR